MYRLTIFYNFNKTLYIIFKIKWIADKKNSKKICV